MPKYINRVSIVLSTYNGEKNVLEQMESLLHQKRVPDEVLIFDDCSSDGTVDIVKRFIKENALDTWKLVVNKKNKGWKRNFIEGMLQAKGELIFPCDQDDIWHDNKLLIMEEIMASHDEINVLVSNYIEFYENSNKKIIQPEKETGIIHAIFPKYRFMNVEYPGCVYCVRKSFFCSIIKYWNEIVPHDSLLWRHALFSYSLYAVDTSLIEQRKHADSTFTVEANNSRTLVKKKNEIIYTKIVLDSLNRYLNEHNLNTDEKRKILNEAAIWNEKRSQFFNSKNIFIWFSLIKYLKYYQTNKKYLLDLYVVIKG